MSDKKKAAISTVQTAVSAIRAHRVGKEKAPRAPRTKLLISIVNNSDELRLKEIIDDCSVALSFTFAGMGTARSAVLDYLGIGETEKSVILSLFPETDENTIVSALRAQLSMYLIGRGISFTMPLSGISEIISNGIIKAATNKTLDGSKIMHHHNRKYDLIIAAVNAGFADTAMEAARSAGAAGGTIIRSRSLENAKAEQFIGITLAEQEELLLILSKSEGKLAIMNALMEQVGLKTEAGGVIFSLPVDTTVGLGTQEETEAVVAEKAEHAKNA